MLYACVSLSRFEFVFIFSLQKGKAVEKDKYTISPSLKYLVFKSLFFCVSVFLCLFPFHLCLSVEKGVEAAAEGGRPIVSSLMD